MLSLMVFRCHHFFASRAANLKLFFLVAFLLDLRTSPPRKNHIVQGQTRGLHDMLPSLRVDDGSLHPTFFETLRLNGLNVFITNSNLPTLAIDFWSLTLSHHLFWKNEFLSLVYFSQLLAHRQSDSSDFLCEILVVHARPKPTHYVINLILSLNTTVHREHSTLFSAPRHHKRKANCMETIHTKKKKTTLTVIDRFTFTEEKHTQTCGTNLTWTLSLKHQFSPA